MPTLCKVWMVLSLLCAVAALCSAAANSKGKAPRPARSCPLGSVGICRCDLNPRKCAPFRLAMPGSPGLRYSGPHAVAAKIDLRPRARGLPSCSVLTPWVVPQRAGCRRDGRFLRPAPWRLRRPISRASGRPFLRPALARRPRCCAESACWRSRRGRRGASARCP